MYKKNQNRQITLKDFNQPLGFKLNPENKWIKKAAMIAWEAGRNFEYYSEDPLVSGEVAAAITRGVQSHKGWLTFKKTA